MSAEGKETNVRYEEKDGKQHVYLRPSNPKFRALLSIDGGGVRGIIPTKVLQGFEKAAKEVLKEEIRALKDVPEEDIVVDIKDCFDMVAGNSAGSILALFIASGGGREELYEEGGMLEGERPGSADAAHSLVDCLVKMIFRRHPLHPGRIPFLKSLTGILFSKYGSRGLQSGLERIFGDLNMGDLKLNAYIPAYELENSRPVGFYSRVSESGIWTEAGYSYPCGTGEDGGEDEFVETDDETEEFDVAMNQETSYLGMLPRHFDTVRMNLPVKVVSQASASAPVYFSNTCCKHRHVQRSLRMPEVNWVDGGVVSINPTMQALAFMSTCFPDKNSGRLLGVKDMAVLSIGTGSRRARAKIGGGRQGNVGWGSSLVSILMDSHREINHAIMDALFDGALFGPPDNEVDRYVRINKVTREGDRDHEALGALDSTKKLEDLRRIGQELADDSMEKMKNFIRNILMAEA